MKHRLLDDMSVAQVLHDDPLEQRGGDSGVPDAFRIHHHDGPAGTDAQAGRLAALHAPRAKQEVFALEQPREQRIQGAPFPVRGAVAASADEHVARIRLHERGKLDGRRWRHRRQARRVDAV